MIFGCPPFIRDLCFCLPRACLWSVPFHFSHSFIFQLGVFNPYAPPVEGLSSLYSGAPWISLHRMLFFPVGPLFFLPFWRLVPLCASALVLPQTELCAVAFNQCWYVPPSQSKYFSNLTKSPLPLFPALCRLLFPNYFSHGGVYIPGQCSCTHVFLLVWVRFFLYPLIVRPLLSLKSFFLKWLWTDRLFPPHLISGPFLSLVCDFVYRLYLTHFGHCFSPECQSRALKCSFYLFCPVILLHFLFFGTHPFDSYFSHFSQVH